MEKGNLEMIPEDINGKFGPYCRTVSCGRLKGLLDRDRQDIQHRIEISSLLCF